MHLNVYRADGTTLFKAVPLRTDSPDVTVSHLRAKLTEAYYGSGLIKPNYDICQSPEAAEDAASKRLG